MIARAEEAVLEAALARVDAESVNANALIADATDQQRRVRVVCCHRELASGRFNLGLSLPLQSNHSIFATK